MTRTVLKIAFGLALAVWTVLLVRPTSQEITSGLKEWNDILPYLVAKALHLTAYAVFAGWGLAVFGRWRWWVVGAVAVHAIVGELGQYVGNVWFATGRVGSVVDVLIDWTGMATGCGVWWVGNRLRRDQRERGPAARSQARGED